MTCLLDRLFRWALPDGPLWDRTIGDLLDAQQWAAALGELECRAVRLFAPTSPERLAWADQTLRTAGL